MRLVELHKVDRIDQERWETTFAGDFSNDAPREWEEQAWALDQQHRFHLALLGVLDLEEAGIIEFANEQDSLFSGRLGRELQRDFVKAIAVGVRGRADINAEVYIRLGLHRADAGILE